VDVTGQPRANIIPAPNLYTVEVVVTDPVMAQIALDANYQVLWQEAT
jgi:hypothetical protein